MLKRVLAMLDISHTCVHRYWSPPAMIHAQVLDMCVVAPCQPPHTFLFTVKDVCM